MFLDILRLILMVAMAYFAVRIPYLLFFAPYVSGTEYSQIHGEMRKMQIARGCDSFWGHCGEHVITSVVLFALSFAAILIVS